MHIRPSPKPVNVSEHRRMPLKSPPIESLGQKGPRGAYSMAENE
jgi:hypothetical protein